MKIACLGDLHFGIRNDTPQFFDNSMKFLNEVFFPYCQKNEITTIIQMGDLMDRRKYTNKLTMYRTRKEFIDSLKGYDYIQILGNHDIFYKSVLDVSATIELLKGRENIKIIDVPQTITFDGVPIM